MNRPGHPWSMQRILLVIGHPDCSRYSHALAERYATGARASGASVEILDLADLSFDPNLASYDQPLERDLERASEAILAAEHLAFFFPMWWAGPPALMKGFIDRVFLPDFAFRYPPGRTSIPEGLLRGRSARVVVTMDSPSWYYRLARRRSLHHAFSGGTLKFCGIGPIRETTVTSLRALSEPKRLRWLDRLEAQGARDARRLAPRARLHQLGVPAE